MSHPVVGENEPGARSHLAGWLVAVARRQGSAAWSSVTALGLFVALTAGMLYPFPRQITSYLRDAGDPLEYAWVLGYSAQRLLADPLHLYDGNVFYPFHNSLAFSDATLASTLTVLPVLLATGNPVLAVNVVTLLTFILAGFGTYLLVKDLTGRRLAGVLAGVVFAFCPYRLDHLSQVPNAASHWLPFVFLCLNRLLGGLSAPLRDASGSPHQGDPSLDAPPTETTRSGAPQATFIGAGGPQVARPAQDDTRRSRLDETEGARGGARWRWAIGFGLTFALQCLSSFYYAFAAALGVAAYLAVYAIIRPRQLFAPRVLLPLATAGVAALAVLVATSLPYFDVADQYGMRRSVDAADVFATRPANYLAVPGINRTWGRLPAMVDLGAPERTLFPGLVALGLAAVGLAAGRRRPATWLFAAVGLTGFVLSLGPRLHLAADQPAVPLPFPLPYALLFDYLPGFQSMRVPARFAVLAMLAVAVLAGCGAAALQRRLSGSHLKLGPVALGSVAVAALALVALGEDWSAPVPMTYVPTGAAVPAVYRWLAAQPERGALVELPVDGIAFNQTIRMYYSTYHGWRIVNGARAFTPPGYEELASVLAGFPSAESLDALASLNIRYVVVHGKSLPDGDLARRAARVGRYADRVRLAADFGDDRVYEVTRSAADPALRVSVAAPCDAQPGESVAAGLAVETSTGSLVALAASPDRVRFTSQWSGPMASHGEATLRWPGPIVPGALWLPLPVTAPTTPGTYQLTSTVDAPGVGQSGTQSTRSVTVGTPPRSSLAPARVEVRGYSVPQLAFGAGQLIPLRIAWRAVGGPIERAAVFFNVFDDRYRVWTQTARPLLGERLVDGLWCSGEEFADVRVARLYPDAPPGYYTAEFGLMDPVTGARWPIVDPAGQTVDKITLGSLRIARTAVPAPVDAVPAHPLEAHFGNGLTFRGWSAAADTLVPGQTLRLWLYWEALQPIQRSLSVFVHLYDAAGQLVAQHDGVPGAGAWPTSRWVPSDVVEDEVTLNVPTDLSVGEYTLAIGAYDPGTLKREPLTGGEALGDDRLLVTKIQVGAAAK